MRLLLESILLMQGIQMLTESGWFRRPRPFTGVSIHNNSERGGGTL